jgi:hypothetical protein
VISPQITLWSQQGSEVLQGTLLVIPIGESLLYVRPLYLRSPQGQIPELKRVIVAHQNRIVMAETLTLALAQIFGRSVTGALAPDRLASDATSVVRTTDGPELEDLSSAGPQHEAVRSAAAEALEHLRAADAALRAGNLARYQREVELAEAALARAVPASRSPR